MKKGNNKVIVTLIVVFVLAFIVALGMIIFKFVSTLFADNDYDKIANSYAADIDGTNGTIYPELADNPVDVAGLHAENPDIYSWIYIPNTNVNYPVAQSDVDDNFYLDHDMYKNYSFPGTIYSQSCNKKDYSDRVTVLYGHNMLNGSMFATLHKFSDPQFFEENKYMYIYTENRKLTYEVVSAYTYDDRHIMNSFDFNDDKVFYQWLKEAVDPRSVNCNVRKDVNLTMKSKMLVLSTCLNGGGDGRYLVQGVLIKDEQTK